MKEQLSEKAKRMCRECDMVLPNGECDVLNRTIETQNRLAEKGVCYDAEIKGLKTLVPEKYVRITGRMRRIGNRWIFERDPHKILSP